MDSRSFDEWFRGSKVTDEHGRPLLVYRGEHGAPCGDGFQTRLGSLSFGSIGAANRYAMHPNQTGEIAMAPRIIPAHLAIRNPVINKQEISFVDFDEIAGAIGRHKSNRLFIELSGHVENTCNWMDNFSERYEKVADLLARKPSLMSELYVDAYPVFDSCQYVAWFSEAGFDGAIHAGSGETAGEAEYKVFSEGQVMAALSEVC